MPRKGKGSKQYKRIVGWTIDEVRHFSAEKIEQELQRVAPKPKVKIYG
jgi:hypothetical protein